MSRHRRRRGSALLIVIWAIMVMSLTVVGLLTFLNTDMDRQLLRSKDFRARLLAESGLALAMHPDVASGSATLYQAFGEGKYFSVHIETEGRGFQINQIVDPVYSEKVRNLFILWGLEDSDADSVVAALLNWVDSDEAIISEDEQIYDEALTGDQFPPNRPFISLQEVLYVRGMHLVVAANPNWQESFTIHGDGKIDINSATRDILQAALGLSEDEADYFLNEKRGDDGAIGTADDFRFDSVEAILEYFSLSSDQTDFIKQWVDVDHPFKRIVSKGVVFGYTHELVVIREFEEEV